MCIDRLLKWLAIFCFSETCWFLTSKIWLPALTIQDQGKDKWTCLYHPSLKSVTGPVQTQILKITDQKIEKLWCIKPLLKLNTGNFKGLVHGLITSLCSREFMVTIDLITFCPKLYFLGLGLPVIVLNWYLTSSPYSHGQLEWCHRR